MPLPSQSARLSSGGRPSMYRRKRNNLGPILIGGVVIAAIAGLVYILLPSGSRDHLTGPSSAAAKPPPPLPAPSSGTSAAPVSKESASKPVDVPVKPAPVVKEPDPPIVEIGQGAAAERSRAKLVPEEPKADPVKSQPEPPKTAPVQAPTPPPVAPAKIDAGPIDKIAAVAAARQREQAGDLVTARQMYSRALWDGKLMPSELQTVRDVLTKINDDLVFSSKVTKDDPYQDTYQVQGGDKIVKINQKLSLAPDWRLLLRLNKMPDASRLREGQRLKVVKGPFHVVVHKAAYRLDLYMGPPEKQSDWLYVRSFTVGLGEGNSTPIGNFIVRKGSKLVDPPWVNPRTGEKFDAGPTCPIGKFWIGLEGVGDSASAVGYGIHGTIDPDSIGKQKSMGCVRLGAEDIALMYELLGETLSNVKIEP